MTSSPARRPATYTASYSASATQPFANVKFQPASSPTVPGYLVDSAGANAARNGKTNGWSKTNSQTRNRNSPPSPDQRVEGVLAVKAVPTSSSRWAEGTVSVTVTQADGG